MTELLLEKFLKENTNWEELLTAPPYNLIVKRDGEYVIFKYNQFGSDMSLGICQESRGIIFHEPTLTPVCVPFFKFFNHGEPNAAEIDWNSDVRTTEKIDGSLMKLWYHNSEWHLSTNGTIDAYKAPIGDKDLTFGKLFEIALGTSMQELKEHMNVNCTYMFEMIHPENEIVIDYHNEARIYLLAQRDMTTYDEMDCLDHLPGTHLPKEYHLTRIDDVISVVNSMNEFHEGIVICDSHFNRIKVKSSLYLLRARAHNNGILTDKRILKLWRADMLDDFLAYAPKKKEQAEEVLELLTQYVNRQESLLKEIEYIENQKEFVHAVKEQGMDPTYAMGRRNRKIEYPLNYFREYLFLPSVLKILEAERNKCS